MPEVSLPIQVPSEDPKKKKTQEKGEDEKPDDEKSKANGESKDGEDLSEEDQQLKNELEMLVERLKEPNTELYRPALETLRTLIRTSTSSMTSVPKPLKFLHPHYTELQKVYETWPASEDKSLFADILSVLAMTYSDTQPRGTLRYRLLSAQLSSKHLSEPGLWGHEYVRHLATELGEEYRVRELGEEEDVTEKLAEDEKEKFAEVEEKPKEKPEPIGSLDDLRALSLECASFLLHHNAEPDAVDLLEELEIVDRIVDLVDDNTFGRVSQYMIACVSLLPPPDDVSFLRTTHAIYLKHQKYPEAIAIAIRLNDQELIHQDFHEPANPLMKRQLAFILARAQVPKEWVLPEDSEEEDLVDCLSNTKLSTHFRAFGKELGVLEAKSLEDVYKSHLENRTTTTNVDSARGNLAGTFVNAFVNAGFGNDKLMVEAEEGNSWIYKNKDHGMMSAAASLGLSLLWDTDIGLSHVDKYTYSAEEHIKAGALLATGILNTGVRTEADAAMALLAEYVENKSVSLKTSAIVGLGLAYAGSAREDLQALLLPVVADDEVSMEVASFAALALGFIYVGSGNGEITGTILQTLMERDSKQLDEKWARYLCLGLALLYVGLQDATDAIMVALQAIDHDAVSNQAQVLVDMCAYAGTGDVLKVQTLLHLCDEHIVPPKEKEEKEKEDKKEGEETNEAPVKDDTFQALAVIGIALVAMGEDIGSEMALRQFNHLMQYGEPTIRKAVPLALGLVSASNPQLPILDTLSKYSHDNDLQVALNAIFAMGLVGAGSNNARLGQMLRQLAVYYHKEPDCLFIVRIAQGLVNMGKGTITINPFFHDRQIMSRTAVAGLLSTILAFTDAKSFILDKYHWMLYLLATAMYPRLLMTLNEELESFPVTVRVGQAVDVVGQAGKPRTISGFQTYTTPVRLGQTERAELATEEFIPFSNVLENFVILRKNPGWESEDKMDI
ncbi:armadillo-type protein [Irpex rosettiformis]|uniref:Armadillo-type protein n=1 Tax=Irpex rosettiformis TaxID=378272 RepID=A0ACB8U3D1_9APHY|nr:armadillo-type protein [Irpex rosettiformis]